MDDKHFPETEATCKYDLEHEMNPNFQRVSISGEDTSGVPLDDLEHASKLLIDALKLRQRYMEMSQQTFPALIEKYFSNEESKTKHEDKKTIADHPIHPPTGANPWALKSPPPKKYFIKSVKGVFHVFRDEVSWK